MSKQDPAAALMTQLRRAKASAIESPVPENDPIAELVFAFLLWEAPYSRARTAFKRLIDASVSHNELRVTYPADIAQILGKTYPNALERAERLILALETIYRREYAVSLDQAMSLGKREGRKYLESIDHMPPFVAARTSLIAFGSHAIPVDDRTLARLIETGVYDEGTTLEQATGSLERAVKASDAPEVHAKMMDWLDRPAPAPGRKKTTKSSTSKKTRSKKSASAKK